MRCVECALQNVPEFTSGRERRRECNGVVESPSKTFSDGVSFSAWKHLQTQRLMGVLAALASMEKIRLNVVTNGEEVAAGSVRGGVLAVGTGNTPSERS